MGDDVEHPKAFGAGTPSVWAGILGVPALWAVHLQVAYALVPWICISHQLWLLHVTTLASLAIGILLIGITWIDFARTKRRQSDSFEDGVHSRGRFLGALGLLVGAMFLVLIAAQGIPAFFIDPCSD